MKNNTIFQKIRNTFIFISLLVSLGKITHTQVRDFREVSKLTEGANCVPYGEQPVFYRDKEGILYLTTWSDERPGSWQIAADKVGPNQVGSLGLWMGANYCKGEKK